MFTTVRYRIATVAVTATLAAMLAVGLTGGVADAASHCVTGKHIATATITTR